MSSMFRVRLLTTLSAHTWRRSFAHETFKEFLKGPKLPPPAQVLRPVIPPPPSRKPFAAQFVQSVPPPKIVFQQEHNTVRQQVFALFNLAKYAKQNRTSPHPVTSSEDFAKLMSQLVASAPELSAKQWTQCLWALNQLHVYKHKFISLGFAEIIRDPYRFDAHALQLVAVAARHLDAPQQLWDALHSAILRCDSLPLRAISYFLFSFADTGKQDRALFDHLCRLELQATDTPTVEDLSQFVYALGRTGYGDSALLQRASMQLVPRMNEVSPTLLPKIVEGIVSYVERHAPQAFSTYEPVIDALASRIASFPWMEVQDILFIARHLKRHSITAKLWVSLTEQLARTDLTIRNLHDYCVSLRLLYVQGGEVPSDKQLERIDDFLASKHSIHDAGLLALLKILADLHELCRKQAHRNPVETFPHLLDFLDKNMFSKSSQIPPEILLSVTYQLHKFFPPKSPTWKPFRYRFSQMLSSLLMSLQKRKGSNAIRASLLSKCLWQQCVWDVYDPHLIQFCLNELETIHTELPADVCAGLFWLQTSLNQLPSVHITYPPALDLLGKVAFKHKDLSFKPSAATIAKVVESLPAGVTRVPSSSALNRLPYEPHLLVQYNGNEVAIDIFDAHLFTVCTVRRSQLERVGYGYVVLLGSDCQLPQNELQEMLRTLLHQAVPSAEATSQPLVVS